MKKRSKISQMKKKKNKNKNCKKNGICVYLPVIFNVDSPCISISNHCKCLLGKINLICSTSGAKINNGNINAISGARSWNAQIGSTSASHAVPSPTRSSVVKQTTVCCHNHNTTVFVPKT